MNIPVCLPARRLRQSTGDRILEQVLNSNDMQPVRHLAEGDVLRKLAKPVGRLAIGLEGEKILGTTTTSRSAIMAGSPCLPNLADLSVVSTSSLM